MKDTSIIRYIMTLYGAEKIFLLCDIYGGARSGVLQYGRSTKREWGGGYLCRIYKNISYVLKKTPTGPVPFGHVIGYKELYNIINRAFNKVLVNRFVVIPI